MGDQLNGEKQRDHQGNRSQKMLDVFEPVVPYSNHMAPSHRDQSQGHGRIYTGGGRIQGRYQSHEVAHQDKKKNGDEQGIGFAAFFAGDADDKLLHAGNQHFKHVLRGFRHQ